LSDFRREGQRVLTRWSHRCLAIVLGAFILSHLAVHLSALAGEAAHVATLDAVQWIYRNPVGESLLVIAILAQVITGVRRVRWSRTGFWARAQILSGGWLVVFLILHTGAALYTHHIYGLETDFRWAAGSLSFVPIRYGFAVYYFLAVLAVFVHIAAAVHFGWRRAPRALVVSLPAAGALVGALIVATFSGMFYPIDVGEDVTRYYTVILRALGVAP
jgi:hypothetical protein